jgi:uncharacterized protein YndB with AHSA1/START domain
VLGVDSLSVVEGNTVSVERVIDAPASEIFALLADAGKHASIDGSGTVDHTTAESIPLAMGSTFSMRMYGRPETLFVPYTMRNTVVEFEKDRRIAWQSAAVGGLVGGRVWRYELTPAETGGTLVRETWDISGDRQRLLLKVSPMPTETERGMRATLQRIAELLEQIR